MIHLTTASPASIANNTTFTTPVSSLYPVSNMAFFMPVRVTRPYLFTTIFWFNGSVVSGNIDAGLYDIAGTKIVSTGSTAQSGTSVIQSVSIASTEIGPGLFYFALAM